MFKHILCPIDGSAGSLRALDVAARLAAEQQAELTVCIVVDPSQAAAMAFGDPGMSAACYAALEEEAKQTLSDGAVRASATILAKRIVLTGQTVPAIVEYSTRHICDLIVMASHGRTGIQRALIGSVAEGVVRHASVPVMIIRWLKQPAKERRQQTAATAAVAT